MAANDYVVRLASADHARLAVRSGALRAQVRYVVRAHAFEQRYLLPGSPAVRLEIADDLPV